MTKLVVMDHQRIKQFTLSAADYPTGFTVALLTFDSYFLPVFFKPFITHMNNGHNKRDIQNVTRMIKRILTLFSDLKNSRVGNVSDIIYTEIPLVNMSIIVTLFPVLWLTHLVLIFLG